MKKSHEHEDALAAGSADGPQRHAPPGMPNPPEGHTPKVADVSAGTIYTCPMHPQIRQVGPGHCPICGMALEPLMPTATDDDREIRSVRRRFWISVTLAVPL